jgi:hypothetical protein
MTSKTFKKDDFNSLTSKEKGLVSQCYKKKLIITEMSRQRTILTGHYLRAALMLPQEEATEMIWDYVRDCGDCVWEGNSEYLNITSTIKTFWDITENKKALGHFKHDGVFIKIAKKGEAPIFYDGAFPVYRNEFDLDWSQMVEGILDFIPRTEEEKEEFKGTKAGRLEIIRKLEDDIKHSKQLMLDAEVKMEAQYEKYQLSQSSTDFSILTRMTTKYNKLKTDFENHFK